MTLRDTLLTFEEMSPYCEDCELWFKTQRALTQHWIDNPCHFYCRWCKGHFYDQEDFQEHYRSDHYWCKKCRMAFASEGAFMRHLLQSPDDHYYCTECARSFVSSANLRSHLNSSAHRGRSIPCASEDCTKTFGSRPGMLAHLESGNCVSGITRKQISDRVRDVDTNNVIINPSRLIADDSGTVTNHCATERAWNGTGYECYFCHQTFKSLLGVNQHLASPRHESRIYKCPLNTCRTNFATLSGVCHHIESEKCGVHRFKEVQSAIDGFVGQMRSLTLA